jgi:hypothetical protein
LNSDCLWPEGFKASQFDFLDIGHSSTATPRLSGFLLHQQWIDSSIELFYK